MATKGVVLVLLFLMVFVYLSVSRTEVGFNMMQTSKVSYGSDLARKSLENMKDLGATTVAFVVFLKQKNINSSEIEPSWDKHYAALRKSIRWAKQYGMVVGVKPQMLVEGSWSGEIKPGNWQQWFAHYTGHLFELAVLAEEEGVDFLVVGTELVKSASLSYWAELIDRVRTVYNGELTYTAHGLDGVANFRFWAMLDTASVSLYPSLGRNSEDTIKAVRTTLSQLSHAASRLPAPLWIAEVGIASRKGARLQPWAWQNLSIEEQKVDTSIQSEVLGLWLNSIPDNIFRRTLVWAWYSDPDAGGVSDNSYTIQNKAAEKLVACKWRGKCS